MSASTPSYQLRVQNVSLHRRGTTEHGLLRVERHHLIFSYTPGSAAPGSRVVSRQQGSNLSGESTGSDKTPSGQDGAAAAEQKQQSRARVKEVYVPFPMIHRCQLRPSMAQSRSSATLDRPDQSNILTNDEELFPPTIGTSQYSRSSADLTTPYTNSPRRPASPAVIDPSNSRPPALRLRCKDFNVMAFHFHGGSIDKTADEHARQVFYCLRDRCCVKTMDDMYAYSFKPPSEETSTGGQRYDPIKEFARMGIKPDDPSHTVGRAWRTTTVNEGYEYSATYPSVLAVPRAISDNILKYCRPFRSKARIPALSYLHPNGGSITRSSQPQVGWSRRNPQDEKLVCAIFASHSGKPTPTETPPNEPELGASPPMTFTDVSHAVNVEVDPALAKSEDDQIRARIYGSTRQNLIVDARPRINVFANHINGGGIEDVSYYASPATDVPTEKVFLNIDNIHQMRKSLLKVVDALGSADYVDLAPNQVALRDSKWLKHISSILGGADMVARTVGLSASHALIHCSDGWDRTSQISAMAQIILDPHYRTLKGFITLVQKDFLSFGHKFRDRQGLEGSEKWFEIEHERVQPSRAYRNGVPAETNQLQALGNKALTGARNWFDKNRNLFGQSQTPSPESVSRPRTPPANVTHSSVLTEEGEKKIVMEDEVSPIFHQFLDAVYQLTYQNPTAFEFNERFLRRLFYHSYSGQYCEFLFNNERQRSKKEDQLPSVWAYFLARGDEFKNPRYVAVTDGTLLFPERNLITREAETRWWAALFGRTDEEMNVPLSHATADVPTLTSQTSAVTLDEKQMPQSKHETQPEDEVTATLRTAKSASMLYSTSEAVEGSPRGTRSSSSVISFDGMADSPPSADRNASRQIQAPVPFGQHPLQADVWAHEGAELTSTPTKQSRNRTGQSVMETAVEGSSNGTSKPAVSNGRVGGLDFAAFAQQNAFIDR